MSSVPFKQLPDDARLWIFTAGRELDAGEEDRLLSEVDSFLPAWTAHRVELEAARDWRYGRFLFVAVDESAVGASGCSIDALVRFLKSIGDRLGVVMVDNAPVLYRDGGEIKRVTRPEFRELAENGAVTAGTVVFNNTLTRVGELRNSSWEVPASESWHGGVFF